MRRFLPAFIATAVAVLVAGCGGGGVSGGVVNNWVPQMTSVTPNVAPIGAPTTTIRVAGQQFLDGAVVLWDGAVLSSNQLDPQNIDAIIPATELVAAKVVQLQVRNPNQNISNTMTFTVGNASDLPTITSIAPTNLNAGSGNTLITITGTKFVAGSVVRWNGADRNTLFVSDTTVSFTATAADLATAGTAEVRVFNPPPGGGLSNAVTFTIN